MPMGLSSRGSGNVLLAGKRENEETRNGEGGGGGEGMEVEDLDAVQDLSVPKKECNQDSAAMPLPPIRDEGKHML